MNVDVVFPKIYLPFINSPKRFNVLEGGRGGAKSWTLAEKFLIEGTQKKLRFLCTREIQKSIAQSVHQLLEDRIYARGYPYKVLQTSIICANTGSEFIFHGLQDLTSQNLKSVEGIDRVLVEEAQTTTKKSLDILVPTIRKPGSYFAFAMNRFDDSDAVFDRFCRVPRDDVLHIHANYYDNPFCSKELRDEAERCRIENPGEYAHIWEGQPMQQGDNKIMRLDKVRAAMDRKVKAEGAKEMGVDVARFGDDRTQLYLRHGLKIIGHKTLTKLRTYEVADHAVALANDKGEEKTRYRVDDTGVGGGVTDELHKQEKNVVPINNGSAAKNPNKYPNAISEMWFEFAEMIDQVELPYDPELLRELCSREYKFDKQGRRVVESKDDFKKRYGRSPDKADSLLLCFYNRQPSLMIGSL